MTKETSKNFAKASLERAEKALKSAKLLEQNGELEDAASRAYYAMFHAARAILFSKGVTAKTHRGTIFLFSEKIVKRGILSEEFADTLRKAFDLRQKSDYELYTQLTPNTVKETIKNAEKFIKKAKELTT
ncbi:MAG: HEPN domain-containing protein [Candidatus Bathyarchaeia archaeon]|nr:HEPN domain-containing protein [Candidatus Bathyarchaeia archaeon]MDI6904139.1 HEPN domain-containing protein [Candidatus Bathyarchaeia archaeon]